MGGAPSLDAEIGEAKSITVEFVKKMTENYAVAYTAAMMKIEQHRQIKEARGAKWELLKLEKKPKDPIRHQGHMMKLSKYLKKWNKRFFIVNGDWTVDYWETEEKQQKGEKPRGSINLGIYYIVRDVNEQGLNRIVKLAEKVNLPVDQLPKPTQYPEFTIELYAERRDCIYLQAEASDFKTWCDMLERCRWYAPSLNIQDDKAHARAFRPALWRTRWQCDMWGWWYGSGGEETQISDAINEKIMWCVMDKVDAKLTMPWAARSRIRNGFQKQTAAFVDAAVKPGWGAMYEAAKKIRPTIEEKMPELVKPLAEAQVALTEKILELVKKGSDDVIQEKVTPSLEPVISALFAPIVDGFRLLLTAFDTTVSRHREDFKENDDHTFLVNRSWLSEYWDAERKLYDLYDPLWEARKVFEDVSPWGILGKARRRLRKLLNNALYTFEVRLKEAGGVTEWDRVFAETREIFVRDCRKAVERVLGNMLFGVVSEFWEKLVIRPARKLIAPLADQVPDTLKQFLDPEDLLEQLLNEILHSTCCNAFSPYASRVEL